MRVVDVVVFGVSVGLLGYHLGYTRGVTLAHKISWQFAEKLRERMKSVGVEPPENPFKVKP